MELLPDRAHVRLRSPVRSTFLHADEDEDGVGVSLNTARQEHREERLDVACVLLHRAAYSRYLALSPTPAPHGHRGQRAIQRTYAALPQDDIAWEAERTGDYVVLRRHASDRLLRANGRYRPSYNGVSVDHVNNRSTMMHWTVEAIPLRSEPPNLPYPTSVHRMIVYVRAEDLEHVNPQNRRMFMFGGRSVFQLRSALAHELQDADYSAIALCVLSDFHGIGRLIPLVTDLPRNQAPLFIVVLTTRWPAALALRYPNVDAQ